MGLCKATLLRTQCSLTFDFPSFDQVNKNETNIVLSVLAHANCNLPENASRAKKGNWQRTCATLPENASRALYLLALTQQQRRQVNRAIAAFRATFSAANVEARDTDAPAPAQGKVWKFSAVQPTYNSSHSDFMALNHGVLENLFGRFVAYLSRLADQISAEGVSATMERASPERVHLHADLIYQLPPATCDTKYRVRARHTQVLAIWSFLCRCRQTWNSAPGQ